ncbi:MAG: dihydrofolate reductase [Alphaproteobacteria bacterium]|nr:dihydrofolate reductase [Alphaproteobacteria bacterium]
MFQHLTSIVAIDRHGAIGCKNRLPWSIKSDMAFFRKSTMGKSIIMGRKTYESIGGCLKGRHNLVLSHNSRVFESSETCRLVNSVKEALAAATQQGGAETFVIGGATTYSEFAPYVDRYLVTIVDHSAADADAFLDEHVVSEFNRWQAHEIARFPAVSGQDEFAFKIVEFSAPDAHERVEMRKALANRFLEKHLNQVHAKGRSKATKDKSAQAAYSF